MKKTTAILAATTAMALGACSGAESEPSSINKNPVTTASPDLEAIQWPLISEENMARLGHLTGVSRDHVEREVAEEAALALEGISPSRADDVLRVVARVDNEGKFTFVDARDIVEKSMIAEAKAIVGGGSKQPEHALQYADKVDDEGKVTQVAARDQLERLLAGTAYIWAAEVLEGAGPALDMVDGVDNKGRFTKVQARDKVEGSILLNAVHVENGASKENFDAVELFDDEGKVTRVAARDKVERAVAENAALLVKEDPLLIDQALKEVVAVDNQGAFDRKDAVAIVKKAL
jgi:hypothetical protein